MLFGATVCDGAAILQAFLLTAGACLIFGPMHALGVVGMSRRVPEFADVYAPFIQLGSLGTLFILPSALLTLRLMTGLALGGAGHRAFVSAVYP
jgi:heme/copper-type cytochrome/quinol oxidase subunit 1